MASIVTFNKTSENPFQGCDKMMKLFQNMGSAITVDLIEDAYSEATSKEKLQLFYSILIGVGDITGRQHHIFGRKQRDNGGNSNRKGFNIVLDWMMKNAREQFKTFLGKGIISEYQCMDSLFVSRVQTAKVKAKNPTIVSNRCLFNESWYRESLCEFVEKIVRGSNPFTKTCVAKFLTPPRFGVRQGHTRMLPETKANMKAKGEFLKMLSQRMGWEYRYVGNNEEKVNFVGYRKWRSEYNGELESVLFSTGKIAEFDAMQFKEWLNNLPASARFRVKNKIFYSKKKDSDDLKWPNLKTWFEEWEKFKEEAQQKVRDIKEQVQNGEPVTPELQAALKEAKKAAKVTTGATNFKELYQQICSGQIDEVKLEAFIQEKVNLPYNSLVFIDCSGSMRGKAFNFATFIASVCLYKNPDPLARNVVYMFGNQTHQITSINKEIVGTKRVRNSLMMPDIRKVDKPLIDTTKPFYENFRLLNGCLAANADWGCTDIEDIANHMSLLLENGATIDELKKYPVWTIVSDGEWNSSCNRLESIVNLLAKAEKALGFKPFVIAMDINDWVSTDAKITTVPNLMYIPSNPAQIEMFLSNFRDMEQFDSYAALLSFFRSDRYDVVRNNVI